MPKLSGLFDSFENLDQINIDNLIAWLKNPPSTIQLENYLANKILYPTTLPLTENDMKIDLAILREALKIKGPKFGQQPGALLGYNPFLNITLRKINIPERFLQYIPNLVSLTWAFVDGLLLHRKTEDLFEDIWFISVSGDAEEIVGSLILPKFANRGESMSISFQGKNYQVSQGSLIILPCQKDRCEISYKFKNGTLLGKQESAIEVYGGRLGLMIDGRIA